MPPGEWHRFSAQISAESSVLSGLLQRRSVVRPLSLRSLQLQRFLMLRSPLLLPVRLDAVQPCDNRRSWVRHEHANHHELHFVTPRVELSSGKSMNIRPPGEQAKQTFDDFRSEVNARYGFADPDDPQRAREINQPNHLLKIAAQSLRNGDKPEGDVRLLVNEIIAERAIEGLISNNAVAERRHARNREMSEQIKDPDSPRHKPNFPSMGL